LLHGEDSVNPEQTGTKACFVIDETIEAGASVTFDFRLSPHDMSDAFYDFDENF